LKTLGWFQKVAICLFVSSIFSTPLWALNLDFDREIQKQETLTRELTASSSKTPAKSFSVRLRVLSSSDRNSLQDESKTGAFNQR